MSILVTGASGYVGTQLIARLLRDEKGQQPPSCGWKCVVSVAVGFCALDPEACAGAAGAVFAPPPPPQNCYAAGTCTPPNASDTYRDRPIVTEPKPTDLKNPEHVPGGQVIDEPTPTVDEHPKGIEPSQGNTTGNEAPGQDGSGQGSPSTGGPATPEPSGTGGSGAPAGSGDTPGSPGSEPSTEPSGPSTPDTSSPRTSDSSGSGSDDSGNPANQSKEPPRPGKPKPKLTPLQRVKINASLGAAGAIFNDAAHRQTDLVTYLKDGGIGLATGSIGAVGTNFAYTVMFDALGSFLDSVNSQLADGAGKPDAGKVITATIFGGAAGGLGYLGELIGPLAENLGKDRAYNIVYGAFDLGAGTCNPYTSFAERKGC